MFQHLMYSTFHQLSASSSATRLLMHDTSRTLACSTHLEIPTAIISAELAPLVNEMNPMYFITNENSGCAGNWWIRHGTKDTDTSLPVIIDLATSLENLGYNVNTWLYWDAGHGVNEDPDEFIAWIAGITSGSQSSSGISTNSASSYNKAGSYSSVSSGANAQASISTAEDGDYACRCVFDSWCELIVVLLAALMF